MNKIIITAICCLTLSGCATANYTARAYDEIYPITNAPIGMDKREQYNHFLKLCRQELKNTPYGKQQVQLAVDAFGLNPYAEEQLIDRASDTCAMSAMKRYQLYHKNRGM